MSKKYFWDNYDKYKFVGWIDYIGGLKEAFISQFKDNMANINENDDYNTRFEKIKEFLSDKNILLVIDNIDKEEDEELKLINSLPITILTTSRLQLEIIDKQIELNFIDEKSSIALFNKHCKLAKNDEFVIKIINLAGFHTLTIELLAKTCYNSGHLVEEFYQKLIDIGFNLNSVIKEKISILWHNETKGLFFEQILKVFALSDIDETEKYILTNLSIFPSVETKINDIKEWLGLETNDAINDLVKKGWLKRVNNKIKIHNIIQEAVREQTKPDYGKCKILIISLINISNHDEKENPLNLKYLIYYIESILDYISEENNNIASLTNNLSWIYRYTGDLKNALDFQLKSIQIKEKILDKNHPDIAISYNVLSLIYKDMRNLKEALEFQLKAIEIREKVLNKNHPDIAISYSNLSEIYRILGNLKEALEFQLKAIEIKEKVLDKNHPSLATSYHNLSSIYIDMGDLKKALDFQLKSIEIKEKILDKNPQSLASSYYNLSLIYNDLKQFDQAIYYCEKAIEIMKFNFPDWHYNLTIMLGKLEFIKTSAGL